MQFVIPCNFSRIIEGLIKLRVHTTSSDLSNAVRDVTDMSCTFPYKGINNNDNVHSLQNRHKELPFLSNTYYNFCKKRPSRFPLFGGIHKQFVNMGVADLAHGFFAKGLITKQLKKVWRADGMFLQRRTKKL
ncbi:Hypothetical predicted protein [Pelobates cultripes]|uniref:Uncharacterized protein n=1 Tax=Pelobates cultripes TaxID=61616 RepID=A0AAD1RU06_PELCU|nr:Hypothetical predicted protein [Pelobates cultripes]